MFIVSSLKGHVSEAQEREIEAIISFGSSCKLIEHRGQLQGVMGRLMPTRNDWTGVVYPKPERIDSVIALAKETIEIIVEDRKVRAAKKQSLDALVNW